MSAEPKLKVVGAGFGRTGTLSLKLALERLGFGKCYHMLEVTDEQVPLWQAASDQAAGADFAWQDLFAGYACALDWPACSFSRPLLERYPESKCMPRCAMLQAGTRVSARPSTKFPEDSPNSMNPPAATGLAWSSRSFGMVSFRADSKIETSQSTPTSAISRKLAPVFKLTDS